jgi:hypothetical protein
MAWYSTGTISVTLDSSAVTGKGTSFIANARVGDAFRGPDGGWYEVTNIASDTAMSISPNYQGANNAAGSYALAPMQGYVKDSADALRMVVNQFGATLAVLGTSGTVEGVRASLGVGTVATENVLPVTKGGTGGSDQVAARTSLGLGSVAVENTLPITKGGTGGNTQVLARSGLGLGTAAVANIGTQPGNVMSVGAGGWLDSSIISNGNANEARSTGLYSLNNAFNSPWSTVQLLSTDWGNDPRWQSQLALGISVNKAYFRSILKDQTGATSWAEIYHTGNTTRAADGTLKAI